MTCCLLQSCNPHLYMFATRQKHCDNVVTLIFKSDPDALGNNMVGNNSTRACDLKATWHIQIKNDLQSQLSLKGTPLYWIFHESYHGWRHTWYRTSFIITKPNLERNIKKISRLFSTATTKTYGLLTVGSEFQWLLHRFSHRIATCKNLVGPAGMGDK